MSIRMSSMTLWLTIFFAISAPALALNPQPEPPMQYNGYVYVIRVVGPNEWIWEIQQRLPGRPVELMDSGIVHGDHTQATVRVRAAIDQMRSANNLPLTPHLAPPSGSAHSLMTAPSSVPSLPILVGCEFDYIDPSQPQVGVVFIFVNQGAGPVPKDTRVHWIVTLRLSYIPPKQGWAVITNDLAPGARMYDLLDVNQLTGVTAEEVKSCAVKVH